MQEKSVHHHKYISYYGFSLFFNLIIWVPVFYEIQKRCGLSDKEIFGIQSIYYLLFCFLEIPTGLFADLWGYRKAILMGSALLVLANLIVVLEPNFYGFLWHFMGISLARSLVSGAASALLYEKMKREGDGHLYKSVEGRARALGLLSKVVCWGLVGFMMGIHLLLPYFLTALSGVVAFFFALRLPEIVRGRAARQPFSLSSLKISRAAWIIIGQGVSMFVVARVVQVNIFQPLLSFKGFSVASFGVVMAVMTLVEAFGATLSNQVGRWIPDGRAIVGFNVLTALSLVLVGLAVGHLWVVMGLMLFSLMSGLVFPIQKKMLGDAARDGARAFLFSFESIIDRVVSSVVLLPMGALVANNQFMLILVVTAFFATLLSVSLASIGKARSAPQS